MGKNPESLGREVWESLQRLVRELRDRHPGGHLIEADLEHLDLRLQLPLRGPRLDRGRFAEQLVRSVEGQLDDAVQSAAAFRPGRVFCHRCASSACDHAGPPPSCRHVFVGYAPTGTPRWEDFAQLCLERNHPEVDRLYRRPPAFLTLVQERRELQGELLSTFDQDTYRLLGQVSAGFFAVRARAEEGRGVLALSIQVAASRMPGGRLRLALNLLGSTPGSEPLERLWERQDDLPWQRSVRWAQAALQRLGSSRSSWPASPDRGEPPPKQEERVQRILHGLARRLQREQRGRSRRTRHAQRRHSSGGRPTRKAVDDARGAGEETVMRDERSGTLVVLGERGRTHFFTPEGQHVSSVRYSRDAIERKIHREQWRPATPAEREALRRKVGG